MPASDSSREEYRRRTLILAAAASAFVVSFILAVVAWREIPNLTMRGLGLRAVPLAASSAFLAALCVGIPTLWPWPRPNLAVVVGLPAMHIALVVAISHLLISRQSALLEMLPAQRQIEFWLDRSVWLPTFLVELGFFLVVYFVFFFRVAPSTLKSC